MRLKKKETDYSHAPNYIRGNVVKRAAANVFVMTGDFDKFAVQTSTKAIYPNVQTASVRSISCSKLIISVPKLTENWSNRPTVSSAETDIPLNIINIIIITESTQF